MPITRRELLGLLPASTFLLTAGLHSRATIATGTVPLSFPQGVASGDPQPDAVMLWTRALPAPGEQPVARVSLLLQLSRDIEFSRPLLQTELTADAASDYTVRAYVDGLEADTIYFYRFLGGRCPDEHCTDSASPLTRSERARCYDGDYSCSLTGRTRTAPLPGQRGEVRMAFVSCQNYEDAYFGAWARMLEDDAAAAQQDQIQFVLHLGDFIYERSYDSRPDGSPMSRRIPPFPDGAGEEDNRHAVSLADYRHLYRTYLTDPHLQQARARWPFICTWDDHEFSNNSFQSYNTYKNISELQAQRKTSANRAWFEYIPAVLDELAEQPAHGFRSAPPAPGADADARNRAAIDTLCIYRKLVWGRNLDLVLTDSRSYRSGPCLKRGVAQMMGLPLNPVELVAIADAGKTYADGNPPARLPFGNGKFANPGRNREPGTLLGPVQRDWLLTTLAASEATWKIWGNALPLLPMRLDLSAIPLAGYEDSIFTIDSWSGYPQEAGYLLRQLQQQGVSGVVSLSGDHHMHAAGTVRWSTTAPDARPVMADFTVAGISSAPMFEALLVTARKDHPSLERIVLATEGNQRVPVWNMTLLDGVLPAMTYAITGSDNLARWLGPNRANPGLAYVDSTANGYGLARLDERELQVRLVTVNDCRLATDEAPGKRHIARFRLPAWGGGERPALQGPEFELGAPFPFRAPKV